LGLAVAIVGLLVLLLRWFRRGRTHDATRQSQIRAKCVSGGEPSRPAWPRPAKATGLYAQSLL